MQFYVNCGITVVLQLFFQTLCGGDFMARDLRESKMTLWSIQSVEAYETFKKTGVLHGDREHCIEELVTYYDWMKKQMINRKVSLNGASTDEYPVWAWYKFCGKKLDLRKSGYATRGTPLVLLTLRVDPSRVLLSDFDLWHCVLGDWYICKSDEDDKKYDDFTYFDLHHRKTWRRVFRVFDRKLLNYNDINPECQSIQAVLWNITQDDIVGTRFFVAK